MAAPVPLVWTHWDSSRGLPPRPRGIASVGGAWDARAALADLRAAQDADKVYDWVDALAGYMKRAAQLLEHLYAQQDQTIDRLRDLCVERRVRWLGSNMMVQCGTCNNDQGVLHPSLYKDCKV